MKERPLVPNLLKSDNPFVSELLKKSTERFSVDSINMPMSRWVCLNTSLMGRPFSMKGYEFQRQILDDCHPNFDCIKISQVGLTEIMVRKILGFLKRNDGLSAIYTLPTEEMFTRIASGRIKPLIAADKVFHAIGDESRSMGTMQFGRSFLYSVPCIETAATSISADAVFNDEVDLSDQKMLALFGSRMQNSVHKINQRFSTPSFPVFGIDLNWQASDQHNYMRRCECCGVWNEPAFTREYVDIPGLSDNIGELSEIYVDMRETLDLKNAKVVCRKCRAPLNLKAEGEWVAKYPSRVDARGYRVTPFCTDKLPISYILTELWKYQKLEFTRGWWNTVLGLPYSDGTIQIPTEAIMECMSDNPTPMDPKDVPGIWVGIDMGQICHITLGRGDSSKMEVIALYTVHVDNIVEHVKELHEKTTILGGAVDRFPYTPTANDIFKVSGGKIIPTEYRGSKEINIVYDVEKEMSHAQVNHTSFMDRVATAVKKKHILISGYGQNRRIVIEHLRDMVRNETPGEPAHWQKLTGNDHFFHAIGFLLAAPLLMDMFRLTSKQEVRTLALGMIVGQQPMPGLGAIKHAKDKVVISSISS